MKRWAKLLGELITIEKGKKASEVLAIPSTTSLRYLQIEDLRADPTMKYCESSSCPRATKSDVIIAWDGANAGTVSCNLEGYIGSTLAILRPIAGNVLSAPFLSRFLEGNFEYLQKTATGATIPHISKGALTALKIPVPPLAEQERIVKLLDEADELRKLRVQADHRTINFIPALFHEMFGDPLTNSKGWPRRPLNTCTERIIDCPHSTPSWQSKGVVCVRTSNLGHGTWNWVDKRFVSENEYISRTRRSELSVGDIVLSREGTIGVAAIVPSGLRLCMGQRLVQVRPDYKVMESAFLLELFLQELAPKNIGKEMSGSTSQHFNVGQLRKLNIIVPPLPLQKEFAVRVSEIRAMQSAQSASRKRLDDLFQSMLHRAFNGEL